MYLEARVPSGRGRQANQGQDVPCSNNVLAIRDYEVQQVRTRFATLKVPTVRLSRKSNGGEGVRTASVMASLYMALMCAIVSSMAVRSSIVVKSCACGSLSCSQVYQTSILVRNRWSLTLDRNSANAHSESVVIISKHLHDLSGTIGHTSVAAWMQEQFLGEIVLQTSLDEGKVGDLAVVHPLFANAMD
jgi:hypothetical protein